MHTTADEPFLVRPSAQGDSPLYYFRVFRDFRIMETLTAVRSQKLPQDNLRQEIVEQDELDKTATILNMVGNERKKQTDTILQCG